jgi:hypothetical protein
MMSAARIATRVAPLMLALSIPGAVGPADTVRTFDADTAGRPPSGFVFHPAREAAPPRWLVQREGANGFLAHAGEAAPRSGFSLAVLDTPTPLGAESVSVRTRLAGGRGATGILWRVQNPDNYYLARLDLSRQDIGLYRVVQGNRVRIEGEDDLELDPGAWHTLKIVQEGDSIRVYLGGIRVLRVRDRTFDKPGAAGVWCTSDAAAHFDDIRIGMGDDHESPRRGR